MNIIKEKTCTVTGHRIISDFDNEELKRQLEDIIEKGYDTFLIGMAIGFDTACFESLLLIKRERKIKIIACIPCKTQAAKFNEDQKKKYEYLLKMADEKIYVSDNYTPYCMMKRNMFMVDNSSLVLAYLRKCKGGTYNTVKYAENKDIKIKLV